MRSRRIRLVGIGLAIVMGANGFVLGQDGQSSSTSASHGSASGGDAGSPLPALPDSGSSFSPPYGGSPSVMPSGRGFGTAGRRFGNSSGDPLFPGGAGTYPTRGGYSGGGNSTGTGNGSFDWTTFFTDATRSSFQFAAPRLFSTGGQGGMNPGGMRPMGGGASPVDLGDGLLRSAGAASSGALGSSLDVLSEAALIERRGLNLTLNDPDKSSDLAVRFSFKEAMGHNSLLGGGGNSFGSMSSFGNAGSYGLSGAGNGFGSGAGSGLGSGPGGGKHGGGASSQVSVQFKF